jgi:tetratricopeptide (TPR) repeat protein
MLEQASFARVTIVHPINLTGTAWWLASGWSDEQRKVFTAKFPATEFMKSDFYRNRVAFYSSRLNKSSLSPQETALYLNDYAWYLATHASDDALGEAEKAVRRSVELFPQVPKNVQPVILDTQAYILMREGRLEEARALYGRIFAQVNGTDFDLEWAYRYSRVLDAMGKGAEADKYARSASGYRLPMNLCSFVPPDGLRRRPALNKWNFRGFQPVYRSSSPAT